MVNKIPVKLSKYNIKPEPNTMRSGTKSMVLSHVGLSITTSDIDIDIVTQITTSDIDIVSDSKTTDVEFVGGNELVTTHVNALVSIVGLTPTTA